MSRHHNMEPQSFYNFNALHCFIINHWRMCSTVISDVWSLEWHQPVIHSLQKCYHHTFEIQGKATTYHESIRKFNISSSLDYEILHLNRGINTVYFKIKVCLRLSLVKRPVYGNQQAILLFQNEQSWSRFYKPLDVTVFDPLSLTLWILLSIKFKP